MHAGWLMAVLNLLSMNAGESGGGAVVIPVVLHHRRTMGAA